MAGAGMVRRPGLTPVESCHDTLWNEHFGVPVPGSSLI
jgi:hypothetical protein